MRAILPVLLAIFIASLGQLTMKFAMSGDPLAVSSPLDAVKSILSRPMVYLGLLFYGVSSFLWLISLSRLPLSYMYPFTALLVVIITVASAVLFHEPVNAWKLTGTGLICAGLLVVAQG